jgi:hypothetical protein
LCFGSNFPFFAGLGCVVDAAVAVLTGAIAAAGFLSATSFSVPNALDNETKLLSSAVSIWPHPRLVFAFRNGFLLLPRNLTLHERFGNLALYGSPQIPQPVPRFEGRNDSAASSSGSSGSVCLGAGAVLLPGAAN